MTSTVTIDELRLFHRIDRELYSRLVIKLLLDPIASMQILALWLWFEQVGYKDLVLKMLLLDDTEVKMIAEEALACLYCLSSISPPLITAINNLPRTQNLLGNPISLQFVYENRLLALFEITKSVNDVCVRVLADIAQEALATAAQNNHQQEEAGSSSSSGVVPEYLRVGNIMMTPAPISHGPGLVRLLYRPVITVPAAPAFPSVWPLGAVLLDSVEMSSQSASNLNPQATPYSPQPFNPNQGTNNNGEEVERNNNINDDEIPDDGRTMFLTFSRGYQLSEREVLDFFTGQYGDCIEDLIMEEVEPNEQPLYARMILDSPARIVEILDGEEKRKLVINAKHVWIRRYVAQQGQRQGRRPPRAAAGPRGGGAVQE